MTQEQRDNSGALFTNDKREKETHPHKKGSARIGGVDYWISAWMKTSKNGVTKYMSLAFKPKSEAQSQDAPRASAPSTNEEW